ncbi:3-succinoylsemialdehyde-pyridine dehydrogenase [compost metagenome]
MVTGEKKFEFFSADGVRKRQSAHYDRSRGNFGPVLPIIRYEDEEDAIRIAKDMVYGLAAYVQSLDLDRGRRLAARTRTGSVYLNYPAWDTTASSGGNKQSGKNREYPDCGIHDFPERGGIRNTPPPCTS